MLLIELLERRNHAQLKVEHTDKLLTLLPDCELTTQNKLYTVLLNRKFEALELIRSCDMILDVAYSDLRVDYDNEVKTLNELKLLMHMSKSKIETIESILEDGLCTINVESLLNDLNSHKEIYFKLKLTFELALFNKSTDDLRQITSEDEDGKD